jgi:RimJ/RimL family protein N-acetyltransferase
VAAIRFGAFCQTQRRPRVREFFPGVLSQEESDREAIEVSRHIDNFGWGFWAVSMRQTNEFIGCIGLEEVYFKSPFSPAIDIGWRLGFKHWGNGYATEGARAALQHGFDVLNLQTIVAYTAVQNTRSRHIMDKIGMSHDSPYDFDHPDFPINHKHRNHVLYRIGISNRSSKVVHT